MLVLQLPINGECQSHHEVLLRTLLQVFEYLSLYIPNVGAVYRYFESRRRILNDTKPGRRDNVARNKTEQRKKQAQRNVSSTTFYHCVRRKGYQLTELSLDLTELNSQMLHPIQPSS